MKSLTELKLNFDLYPQSLSSQIRFLKKCDIDWDVYLPSRKRNLQRDFVWTLNQKRELIWSVLIGRHIPHCAFMNIINKENERKDVYLIIDGKQRLSTIFDFIDDKFTIILENNEYLYSELPHDYQLAISNYYIKYYVVNEPYDNRITDEQKISWFKFINFAGTEQDKEHLNGL